jgi:hypothetical protein
MNKIDTIIDALESAYEDKAGWCDKVNEALYAAHELKALKPVAWGAKSIYGDFEGLSFEKQPRFDTPLYALEVTK